MQRTCCFSLLVGVVTANVFFFLYGGIDSIGSGAGGKHDVRKDTVAVSGLISRMSVSLGKLSWKNGCER